MIVGRDEGVPAAYVSQPSSAAADVSITTNTSTKQAQGTIVFRAVDNTGRTSVSVVGTYQFGGNSSTSQVTDASTYSMTQSTDPNRPSTIAANGQTSPISAVSALASSNVSGSSTAPPTSVTQNLSSMCQCAYLTWGWWSTTYTGPNDAIDNDKDVQVKVVSAPYVVGQVTTAVQMPQTGSATYSGFMTGNVWNGSTLSSVTGSYNNSWNYGSRAGSFNASFDNVNYSGTNSAVAGSSGVHFTGSFTGGNRTGTLAGSFFGPQAQNQAGGFNITNNKGSPAYLAAGIFAGSKR